MSKPAFPEGPGSIPLALLDLDEANPRLPDDLTDRSQPSLRVFIAESYDAIAIARSIARHGYFASEPVIVVPEKGRYVVVEGNRRLVALQLLKDPSLAQKLDDATEWDSLSEHSKIGNDVAVVVAPDRQSVAPIIGYRHISGIEPWDPYQKARFIASLVDEGMSFEQVGNIVGERTTDVAAHYRNHAIVVEAGTDFKLDIRPVVNKFGVFTRAMNSAPLREYIGAPTPKDVSVDTKPIPAGRKDNAQELISWLFGDGKDRPVIAESRNITELGEVVNSEDGLRVLRQTRDLEAAYIAAGGLRERLKSRLNNARTNLTAAREDMASYADDEEIQSLLAACADAVQELVELAGLEQIGRQTQTRPL